MWNYAGSSDILASSIAISTSAELEGTYTILEFFSDEGADSGLKRDLKWFVCFG